MRAQTRSRPPHPAVVPGLTADVERYEKLRSGIQIGPCRVVVTDDNGSGIITGTLGLIVRNLGTGRLAMLSNNHVLYGLPRDKIVGGTKISQPAPTFMPALTPSADYRNACARNFRGVSYPVWFEGEAYGIDAAIADLMTDDVGADLRPVDEMDAIYALVDGSVGQAVTKIGAQTGLTRGRIATLSFGFGGRFPNQIVVEGVEEGPFAAEGDSGSVLLDEQGGVIGLVHAVMNAKFFVDHPEFAEFACLAGMVLATPIRPVFHALGIAPPWDL